MVCTDHENLLASVDMNIRTIRPDFMVLEGDPFFLYLNHDRKEHRFQGVVVSHESPAGILPGNVTVFNSEVT